MPLMFSLSLNLDELVQVADGCLLYNKRDLLLSMGARFQDLRRVRSDNFTWLQKTAGAALRSSVSPALASRILSTLSHRSRVVVT